MRLQGKTLSLCNTCYREIPAVRRIQSNGVWLQKKCPVHGEQVAMLERDPVFCTFIDGLNSRSIYGGYFVDVTRTCNLRCKFCFYALQKKDPEHLYSVESILAECETAKCGPLILTGGEPTMHPQLAEIITEASKLAPVELLTNGVKLANRDYYDEIMPLITSDNAVANLNMSIHEAEADEWMEVLALCAQDKIKVESCLLVVDGKQSFERALDIIEEYGDTVIAWRLKGASRIWNEQKPAGSIDMGSTNKVFVSDMLGWLEDRGGYKWITEGRCNKSVFVNVLWKGHVLMPVSWHDVGNVDLMDIDCPPYYRARNGEVANFVTACLINEGMAKGFLGGAPYAEVAK